MAPPEPPEELVCCAQCGAPGAPAVCAGCHDAHYCGPECQRAAWKSGHRLACRAKGRSAPAEQGEEQRSSWPVRCPSEILGGQLPRLDRLDSPRAQEMLCKGSAFVAPMDALLGTQLLKWDFQYLQKHLPPEQKYGVMLDAGSGKIVMSHTARNGARQVDMSAVASGCAHPEARRDDGRLGTSDQARMTFNEFLAEADRFKKGGCKGKLPYFGIHLLWRFKPTDNGYLGAIDQEMESDLWSIKFDLIKQWQDQNVLPLVQRFYLFAGLGGTLYHCHYDLQPNIHVQLTGRKRFILFPPEDWAHLYPFPVHHDLDRRSMVDLDAPNSRRFSKWRKAHGLMVELNPGDALYIPPYWWHHVQSLSPETTSMAMWFFEFFPHSTDVPYGVGLRASDIMLLRDVEELVGEHFPDVPGEEDCTKARPKKAAQVAAFLRWLRTRLGLADPQTDEAENINELADRAALALLQGTPEEVESTVLGMIAARCQQGEEHARDKLRAFLTGRL